MTIMLAGGVTVGAQGFTPEAFADHNANLFVSAEKTGNSFHGLQVVEVVIIDDDLSASSKPDVTINGEALTMTATTDGNHYAYFASSDVADVDDGTTDYRERTGLSFGTSATHIADDDCVKPSDTDASAVYCVPADDSARHVIKSEKPSTNAMWPFIQLYPFSGTVEIQYNRAGGAELASLEFEDNSKGMTLDRDAYPPGSQIHAVIDDHRLNIDPTSADAWTWNAADGKGELYYALADTVSDNKATGVQLTFAKVDSDAVCEECSIVIDPVVIDADSTIIETADDVKKRPTATTDIIEDDPTTDVDESGDYSDAIWVSVREIGGPNTGMFSTTDIEDNSVLRVSSDAPRDRTATIGYDDSDASVKIRHSVASISIDAPEDVWTSGLAVPITVVDDDANKNSRADETLGAISDSGDTISEIPILVTGTPYSLGDESLKVLLTYDVADVLTTDILANIKTVDDSLISGDSGIYYSGAIEYGNDDPETDPEGDITPNTWYDSGIGSEFNSISIVHSATEQPSTLRAILNFNADVHPDVTHTELTAFNELTGVNTATDPNTADLLKGVSSIHVYLPSVNIDNLISDDKEKGVNVVNFDFSGLSDIAKSFTLEAYDGVESVSTILDESKLVGVSEITRNNTITASKATELWLEIPLKDGADVGDINNTPIVFDIFSFGFKNNGEASGDRIANQIVRLELEESKDNPQGTFTGEIEYIMINQLNILVPETYTSLSPIGDKVSFIVIEDLTGSDAPTVTYLDTDTEGEQTPVSAKENTPSHSGIVSLNVESFKVADTVTVTLEDLDLNVQSELTDIYTVVNQPGDDNHDAVGIPNSDLGLLLEVTFDDNRWTDFGESGCTGLGDTKFTLGETSIDSGVFEGTFQIPDTICIDRDNNIGAADRDDDGKLITPSVTGLDIAVNYVDFRDASGEITEVSSDAGVKANTGSVSFDRTVYPVPFGNSEDTNGFEIDAISSNADSKYLPMGDLIVYVSINDPDFDISASGEDSIAVDGGVLEVSISRDSNEYFLYGDTSKKGLTGDDRVAEGKEGNAKYSKLGSTSDPITEIAPDAGIFEASITISADNGHDGKILQGDILRVEYEDPTDASGEVITVTDSATFDLRNGVLQSDKSVYIIGSDMILTLIEPDLDLDSSQNETYTLDLIEWDSSAHTTSMGNAGGEITAFDPEPTSLRETGPNTGIFQVVVEIPAELDGNALERGEEIELVYVDNGPSGSEHVHDNSEDISLTVFTSNFGATVEFDQKIYTWTDKVYVTIVAPDHNFDSKAIDSIGDSEDDEVRIGTREGAIDEYKLVETGADTGIFTGEIILVGNDRSLLGDLPGVTGDNEGPTGGQLETKHGDGISLSFEFSGEETVLTSSLVRWNIGEVQWLEASYPASGNGILRIIDPDMSLNPEAVDNFEVDIVSSTDAGGISLTVTETNEATGIFEGTVFFTTTSASSGHRVRIAEGDTVTAYYTDQTLPEPYTTADSIDITATTLIGTIVPPLERAPASDLRVVDPFGNSLSTVSPDQQVQVSANLANGQDRDQDFAYLVQIQGGDGVTVHLAWIAGTLSPGQSFSPAVSWTPSESGTYTVTAFVWESVDNPTALSPPITIDVDVN